MATMQAAARQPAHPWILQWQRAEAAAGSAWLAVPSSDGARGFRRQGWLGFREQVAPWALAQGLDPAALRVVSALSLPGPLAALPHEPQLLAVRAAGTRQLALTLRMPFELALFQGHFPTVPIVPGAVLTGWAAHYAARHAGWPHDAVATQSVKFRCIVQPGHDYLLELGWDAAQLRLDFCYRGGTVMHAMGSLTAPAA
jgi:3-hydroxymyristoyl/3-hydroxydecanoyl-(acyl carrier protein) dehydratase